VQCEVALRDAAGRLAAAGIESPEWDARQLLAHAVGESYGRLPLTRPLSPEELDAFASLVGRRAQREPLQHLVGTVGFRYIDLDVGPGVFIPRPESEFVAGLAIDAARAVSTSPTVVDLCSGSGCIPLAIANEIPSATVYAVEREPDAVDWLRRNADRRQAAGDAPVTVIAADINELDNRVPELLGHVDVVVSNPPYVAEHELELVDPEVREHDPRVALVAGADGLDVIRAVIEVAERLVHVGSHLVVEHSDRQGQSAPALLAARPGWAEITDHDDLARRPRAVTATWVGRR
jgi:release factor glutamine methyltransferase